MIRNTTVLLILCLSVLGLNGQNLVINNPFAAEQSHADLVIDRILFYSDSTVVKLSVTNRLERNGWFCADKNIYLEDPHTRRRYYRTASFGIPTCPSVYNFKRKGEILSFTLVFPPMKFTPRTLNLIEDCNRACFYFKNIILNDKLNGDIRTFNRGVELYTANRIDEAVTCFERIVADIPPYPTHVYGYAFYHLVVIWKSRGDLEKANYWLKQLRLSALPDRYYFVKAIKRDTGLE